MIRFYIIKKFIQVFKYSFNENECFIHIVLYIFYTYALYMYLICIYMYLIMFYLYFFNYIFIHIRTLYRNIKS